MSDALSIGGVVGGLVALIQVAYTIYKDKASGALRKGEAEAAQATIEVAQAENALPHVAEALALGNVGDAVSVQQQVINGLRAHTTWLEEQLTLRDQREEELRKRLAERDAKIDELEARLTLCEDQLASARSIVNELRASTDHHPTIN